MQLKQGLLTVSLQIVLALTAVSAFGQARSHQADFDRMLDVVRADIRADKAVLVKGVMKLTPTESDKFWDVYRRYESEVIRLNDERIKIIKDYAAKYESLTQDQADELIEQTFAWETRRTQLRKLFFPQFVKATSAVTAAKFFQVEHRLDLAVDLVLAANIPGLFEQTVERVKQ
jgi:hypothetical protein